LGEIRKTFCGFVHEEVNACGEEEGGFCGVVFFRGEGCFDAVEGLGVVVGEEVEVG